MTHSEEIGARSDDARRFALATILMLQGSPCTLPADIAEPLGTPSSGDWNVTCNEGEYTVLFTDASVVVVGGHSTYEDTTADPGGQPPPLPSTQNPADDPPAQPETRQRPERGGDKRTSR